MMHSKIGKSGNRDIGTSIRLQQFLAVLWFPKQILMPRSTDFPMPRSFSPLHLFEPIAPVNPNPHAGHGEQESQAHGAPELTASPVPGHKNVVDRRRSRQREVRKISSRKETIARQG